MTTGTQPLAAVRPLPAAVASRLATAVCTRPETWNGLARSLPGGTAFHDWDFLDLQERLLGVRIERLLLLEGDEPAGALPVARRGRRGIRAPWLPFPMLGPVVAPGLLPAAVRALRAHQRRTGLVLARFDLAPALVPAGARLTGGGVRGRDDGTVVLDLAHGSVAAMDAGMAAKRRQAIRRAERAGVVARPARAGELPAVLDDALTNAYGRRSASNPYPADLGDQVERWARGRADVHIGVVEVAGEVAGATVLLGGHPVASGWVGACLPAARAANAEPVLLRSAFVWAVEHGHVAVDFGGRVDDEVERFKRSFGAAPQPYQTVESFLGPYRLRRLVGGL